jgi:hypothetical protein
MNKPILMATIALLTLIGSAFAMPAFQIVNAQYSAPTGGYAPTGSIEQQLKLAREKVSNAQGASSIGLGNSGTPMVATGGSSTLMFIIAMVVIFGGVSVAFFIRARAPSKEAAA